MTNIHKGLFVLIDTFMVDPARQQEMVDALAEATDQVMRHIPGFVSANLHKSLDGKRVVNYAQWRSKADFDNMMQDADAIEHMARAGEIAQSSDPVGYEVASIHSTR